MRDSLWKITGGLVVALALAAGCASNPPTVRAESSSAAIRAAEEVGANHVPQAALHLQLAKEQSDRANSLMKTGDNDQAEMLLLRAEADAELALALAREDSEKADAEQAVVRVRELKQKAAQ
jgi:hypothetical protein